MATQTKQPNLNVSRIGVPNSFPPYLWHLSNIVTSLAPYLAATTHGPTTVEGGQYGGEAQKKSTKRKKMLSARPKRTHRVCLSLARNPDGNRKE